MTTLRSMVPALMLVCTAPAWALDIVAPGVIVPKGDPGVVMTDLVCSPPAVGIYLESGARVLLNGHVLDGCTISPASPSQTDRQRLQVRGPGEIRNAGIHLRAGTLKVYDVTITDSPSFGIIGSGDSADGPSLVRARNVTVTGSGFDGVRATRVRARDLTTNGNGTLSPGSGIFAPGGVSGRRIISDDNAVHGVAGFAGKVRLSAAEATGNGCAGVAGESTVLVRSTIDGNDTSSTGCADVISGFSPRVKNTVCGTSSDANEPSNTWGVCSDD